MRMRADIAGRLEEGLGNISLAPLKPQQRLFILIQFHTIPVPPIGVDRE